MAGSVGSIEYASLWFLLRVFNSIEQLKNIFKDETQLECMYELIRNRDAYLEAMVVFARAARTPYKMVRQLPDEVIVHILSFME